jgi:hypothetical protein
MTIQFFADEKENKRLLGYVQGDLSYSSLSFYTLCRWADALRVTYPNPCTVAWAIKQGAAGILELDDLGNFLSWA